MAKQKKSSHSRVASAEAPRKGASKFSKEDIEQARMNIKRAIELAGWVDDSGNAVCPKCEKGGPNRVKLFPGGGWQCYSAEWCNPGDKQAVNVLVDAGWNFSDAVAALLGKEVKPPNGAVAKTVLTGVNNFKAECDIDVYNELVACGNATAAAEYYARWHISPEAVVELGSTRILDVDKMKQHMTDKFGIERLVKAGLVRPADEPGRKDYWVVNNNYPVIEPHKNHNGDVVGVQARASEKREERIAAHKAYSSAKKEAEVKGETFRPPTSGERYVGKFSSLRGGQPGVHLVGGGIPTLAEHTKSTGETMYIVEGLKDLLAMRTMGFIAYALPGVGISPPVSVMKILMRHNIALAFDADDGGDGGAIKLAAKLARFGIIYDELGKEWAQAYPGLGIEDLARAGLKELGIEGEEADYAVKIILRRKELGMKCYRKRPPQGMDITDVLVQKMAAV